MENLPDLSHLTPDERTLLEQVFLRQRKEEEWDTEIMRRKANEVQVLEESIRQRSEQHKKAGVELDATCHICLKTKFADGIGHICNYCSTRCCARCSGKVTLRSNKVIWVCIVCRKKQELLSKTGQWINKDSRDGGMQQEMLAHMAGPAGDKRPKLERAHSAAEKENQPLLLRRQYSQQEQGPTFYRGEIEGLMRTQQQLQQSVSGAPSAVQQQTSSIEKAPPSVQQQQQRKNHHKKRSQHQVAPQLSFSSSDEEIRSTPDCTSGEEPDRESEKGDPESARRAVDLKHAILDENVKHFLANPLSWNLSADRQYLIGHMLLRKTSTSTDGSGSVSGGILGLKVVGGKHLPGNIIGAIVEKVKKGSVADIDGQLKPGDEVLEWNGRSLRGKRHDEVADIIAESKQDAQVELFVSRPVGALPPSSVAPPNPSGPPPPSGINMGPRRSLPMVVPPPMPLRHHHSSTSGLSMHKDVYDVRREKPAVMVTSPGSPDLHARVSQPVTRKHTLPTGGRVQVKVWYDRDGQRLMVTVVCASSLGSRYSGEFRNTYVKLYLLPERLPASKRRTKLVGSTNEPRWNETFVYPNIKETDLKLHMLELSVWDWHMNKDGPNLFLGEAIIPLSSSNLQGDPEWVYLGPHSQPWRTDLRSPTEHLSPPSTISRLSDSDTSECDVEDGRERRVADGASISSVGSSTRSRSTTPPHETDQGMGEPPSSRRSRRDMSPQGRRRVAGMVCREKPASYQPPGAKVNVPVLGPRSHSAAPAESPYCRSRSKSPRRSLSPPDGLSSRRPCPPGLTSQSYVPRFSRSATATPTTSPRKRQLPQTPVSLQHAFTDRTMDSDARAQYVRNAMRRQTDAVYRARWSRQYTGLSDSDLSTMAGRSTVAGGRSTVASRSSRYRRVGSPDKDVIPADFGDSDIESVVSVTSSAFSTQSERPRGSRIISAGDLSPCRLGEMMPKEPSRGTFTRSLSNTDVPPEDNAGQLHQSSLSACQQPDGSLSDTAVGNINSMGGTRRNKLSSGVTSKKSNSTSQLSATGRKRRLGFNRKGKTSFSVHRSEEVLPGDVRFLVKQGSSVSSDGEGSGDADSRSSHRTLVLESSHMSDMHRFASKRPGRTVYVEGGPRKRSSHSSQICVQRSQEVSPSPLLSYGVTGSLNSIASSVASSWPSSRTGTSMPETGQLSDFIDGLGPGQLVGRQVLGAPSLGDIQLSLCHQKGYLEVEVIRARGLQMKPGAKSTPAPWVKVYLVNGKRCIEKQKTQNARKTLDPLYQEQLVFREPFHGCILQVTVWGDYGRMEGKKVFMGLAQIVLDELNLSNIVIGWYKLFANLT